MLHTNAISHLLGSANSKLATFIRQRADKEAELIRHVKSKNIHDPHAHPRKRIGRFSAPASFSKPTPLVQRGMVSGPSPFHLKMRTITRSTPDPALASYERPRTSNSPAFEHAEYIERDGAAETLDVGHEAYIARPGAVEDLVPQVGLGDMERAMLGVPELDALGPAPHVADRLAIVSNISDDIEERQNFWRLVNIHERAPRTAKIRTRPWVAPEWWEQLRRHGLYDKKFEAHLLAEKQRYDAHAAVSNRRFKSEPYKVPIEDVEGLFRQMRTLVGWSEGQRPAQPYVRKGRTQFRFDAELPADISPQARLAIVRDFCSRLEILEVNDAGVRVGMMYTAVIHAPDAQNDRRNYHLHLIAYDRPCRLLVEHGEWDFTVAETYRHRGEERTRYPHRQKKLTISQSRRVSGREGTGKDFIKAVRTMFADCVNKVVEPVPGDRSFHPGSYVECGIDRRPTEHLGGLYAAEQIGVSTEVGDRNAIILWEDREREVHANFNRRQTELRKALASAHEALSRHRGRSSPALDELAGLEREAREAEAFLQMQRDYELLKLNERRARSRAETVLAVCDDQLTGHASGTNRAKKERNHLARRRAEAQSYLEDLELSLADKRKELDRIERVFAERSQRLTLILNSMGRKIDIVNALPAVAPTMAEGTAPQTTSSTISAFAVPPSSEAGGKNVPAAVKSSIETVAPPRAAPTPADRNAVMVPDRNVPPAPITAAVAAVEKKSALVVPSATAPLSKAHSSPERRVVPNESVPASDGPSINTQDVISGAKPEMPVMNRLVDNAAARPKAAEARRPTNLPAQPAVKPAQAQGSGSAGHARITALLRRVAAEHLIVTMQRSEGVTSFFIPALAAELSQMQNPTMIARMQAGLRNRYRFQEEEVGRVISWIKARAPRDAAALDLAFGEAPAAVTTLYKRWAKHGRVQTEIAAIRCAEPAVRAAADLDRLRADPAHPIQIVPDIVTTSASRNARTGKIDLPIPASDTDNQDFDQLLAAAIHRKDRFQR